MSSFSKYSNKFYGKYSILAVLLVLGAAKNVAQNFNYAPNSIHFCQLQNKYAATLSVGLGQGNNFISREWQAAFSPIEHGAIMINYFDEHKKAVLEREEEGGSSGFGEIGIGAYEHTESGTASIFVGFGKGSIFNNYVLKRATSFDFQRWFVQPTILRYNKNFEWGVALRFNYLAYSHGEVDYSISDYDLRAVKALAAKSPFFLPELGLHAGLNFSLFTGSINLTSLFYAAYTFNFEKVNSSLMFTFNVGKLYQKKKSQPKKISK